jgi:hypothetical protein
VTARSSDGVIPLVFREKLVVRFGCAPAWRVEVTATTLPGEIPKPAGVELIVTGLLTVALKAPPPDTVA